MKNFVVLLILIAASFCAVSGQDGTNGDFIAPVRNAPVNIPKFDISPVIDGKLDDAIWKKAAVFDNFVQIQPGDNIAPSKETKAYVGYDEKFLYVGFHAFDDPGLVRATIANRDNVFADDNVRITLDTFDDQRRAYIFFFNPFGIQADGIMTDGQGGPDLSVDIVMESKGVLLDDGYSVEVKIPFKSLRYAEGKGQSWGFNVGRRIPRLNDESDSWAPIIRNISSLRQIGKISGLDDIKSDRNIEIVPSMTLSESAERVADASLPLGSRIINYPVKKDIGVSVKYQISPNITLDAAINPDFAEVEADAPVVRANERFPIFFPEKRTFFLEGIDYFRTPLQVVNTRNIADPDVAVKLTGKIGRNTFGLLSAIDRFPGTTSKAYIGVMRLKRDLGAQSHLGFVSSTYHFGAQRHNNLAGIDGRYQLDKQTAIGFQFVATNSNRRFYDPDTNTRVYRTGNGFAYDANYDYSGKNRGIRLSINGKSSDYRADVGFTRRTNTYGGSVGWRLASEPNAKKTLIGLTTRTSNSFAVDGSGRLQQFRTSFNTDWSFQKQLRFKTGTDFEIVKIYEEEFGARRNAFQQGIFFGEPFRKANQLTVDADIDKTFGQKIKIGAGFGITTNKLDFDFGASDRFPRVSPAALMGSSKLDPGNGFSFKYDLNLELQPTDPWSVELKYERENLKRSDTDLTAFDSNIYSLRSTYQFTRFTFLRTRLDYETVEGTINSQVLMGWSPNPGTAFYVGYNDNSIYRGFNDFRDGFDEGFRRDGRRFFIRVSYLFRKSI